MDQVFIDRFWDKVDKGAPDECWEWQAGLRSCKGYGVIRYRDKSLLAHRAAYAISIGPIPDGAYICHHCDNPRCVNPAHLFAGSHSDNMRDAAQKGRLHLPTTHQVSGEEVGTSKLTEAQVREIRRSYEVGDVTQVALAQKYRVHRITIFRAIHGVHWSCVAD